MTPHRVGLLVAMVACLALAACTRSPEEERRAASLRLQARLVAPCCWMQTLDVHESPLARALRAEIDRRLAAGEPADTIEEDLVARHGERLRAVAKGGSLDGPSRVVPAAGLVALLAGVLVVRRWVRRGRAQAEQPLAAAGEGAQPDRRYEDQLDDELDQVED